MHPKSLLACTEAQKIQFCFHGNVGNVVMKSSCTAQQEVTIKTTATEKMHGIGVKVDTLILTTTRIYVINSFDTCSRLFSSND